MPRTLPSCARIVYGVHFVPVSAPVAQGKRAFRYQCLHPFCTNPLHAGQLSRHVHRHHVQCFNNFRENGVVIAVPEDWEVRLLGPLWGSASTEEQRAHGTEGAAAASQHESVQTPQLPASAEQTAQAPQVHVDTTLPVGHGAQSTAQRLGDTEVCVQHKCTGRGEESGGPDKVQRCH
jgi:hypothetical protein